jgi:hypothetical protein
VLTICDMGWRGTKIILETEMNGGEGQSSLGGHVGRNVVGDDGSLIAFYKPKGGHERGQKGMRVTVIVDLQCAGFEVERDPGVEMAKGRGGNGACVS